MQSYDGNTTPKYISKTYELPELNIGDLVLRNRQIDVFSETPFPKGKIIVGFMGSAGNETDKSGKQFVPTEEHKELGENMGKMVADRNCILSNGAAWGLPYFPIRGAKNNEGYTLGISPYQDKKSHEKRNPIKHLDLVLYAGVDFEEQPSFKFILRDAINTLYPDVVISMGGRYGTLDEDSQVIEQGGIFIPLRGSGGATDLLIDSIENKRIEKDTGAKIIIPPDQSLKSLEEAIDEGISEARGRWKAEGRTQNRFSHVAYELERLMEEEYQKKIQSDL